MLLEVLRADACHVHEAEILVSVAIHVFSDVEVLCKGLRHESAVRAVIEADFFERRVERGMSAVVRPVCVDDFELCQGRVSALIARIIFLHEFYIFRAHRKAHLFSVVFEIRFSHRPEAFYHRDVFRHGRLHLQILRLFIRSDLRVYRIHAVFLYRFEVCITDVSLRHYHSCKFYSRICFSVHELDTLRRRICSLVVLARQIFHCEKNSRTQIHRHRLFIHDIYGRFCKYCKFSRFISSVIYAVHIVTVQDPYS